MATTQLGSVIDALQSVFQAAVGAAVPVYDGAPISSSADTVLVLVGHDGNDEVDTKNYAEQVWGNLATTTRYERGTVVCVAISQSGDTDLEVHRDAALALVTSCATALRSDLTLGGVVMSAQLATEGIRQLQNTAGAGVVAEFTVTYLAQV